MDAPARQLPVAFEAMPWGVRGSTPVPGADTTRYGGNTSCIEVRGGEERFVLDAGTGLIAFGRSRWAQRSRVFHLVLSHLHWDHIQGLPFFEPIHRSGCTVHVWGPADVPGGLAAALGAHLRPPVFPVAFEDFEADVHVHPVRAGEDFRLPGGFRLVAGALHHPGGSLGYRVERGGAALCYATDTEPTGDEPDEAVVRLARHAQVLVYDAMFTRDEYLGRQGPSRVGWGHSTWEDAVAVAQAAQVGTLVLFHHHFDRDDASLERIEAAARAVFPATVAAREGRPIPVTVDTSSPVAP